MGFCVLRVLKKCGWDGLEGTQVSGVRARSCWLKEMAAGKLLTGTAEVSSGAVGAVACVAENHLRYGNRKGAWTFGMVEDG